MQNLTFNELPLAVSVLTKEVSEIKNLLLQRQDTPCEEQQENLLTAKEAAKFLDLSVATIYSKVSRGELPVMKRGNRLYFSDIELLDYLKNGRKITYDEADAAAESYFAKK